MSISVLAPQSQKKPYSTHLTFNASPVSLNKKLRSHWSVKNRENKKWDSIIAIAILSSQQGKPKKPLEKARIRITRHHNRFLDFDGLVGSLKPVVDALVTAGLILDDSWKVLGSWEVNQVFRPKKDGMLLEVIVEEVS